MTSTTETMSTTELNKIGQPLQIGPMRLKNWIVVPARVMNGSKTALLSDRHLDALFEQPAVILHTKIRPWGAVEGPHDLALSMSAGLGSDSAPGTNAGQLLAAGYATCFHSAPKATQRANSQADFEPVVSVKTGIDQHQGGCRLDIALTASTPSLDPEDAKRYLAGADDTCPYPDTLRENATRAIEVGAQTMGRSDRLIDR